MSDMEPDIPQKNTEIPSENSPEISDQDELEDAIESTEKDAVVFDSSAVAAISELIKACTEALKPAEQSEVFNNAWPPQDFRRVTMRIYRQVPSALAKILQALGD